MTQSRVRRTAMAATVVRTERLGPSFVRVVLGGLVRFAASPFADSYVKLVFLDPRTPGPLPVADGLLDLSAVGASVPPDARPRLRTYTVRSWDPGAHEMTVDFVVHGDAGIAGPWAARAVPGDPAWVVGPGGAYAPDAGADWHLLVGDESALPAVAAAVELLPAGSSARVLVEIPSLEDRQVLEPPPSASVEVTWLPRDGSVVGRQLVDAVRGLDWPPGRVQAFVHGEAGFVADLRRHLRIERRVDRDDLSISGYWRLGSDDEGWRAVKRAWTDELERAEVAAGVV